MYRQTPSLVQGQHDVGASSTLSNRLSGPPGSTPFQRLYGQMSSLPQPSPSYDPIQSVHVWTMLEYSEELYSSVMRVVPSVVLRLRWRADYFYTRAVSATWRWPLWPTGGQVQAGKPTLRSKHIFASYGIQLWMGLFMILMKNNFVSMVFSGL